MYFLKLNIALIVLLGFYKLMFSGDTFLFIHSKQFSSGTNIATMYIPISVALRSEKNVSPENISL